MSTSMSSHNQENLKKILALSMTNSFTRLIEKGGLTKADKNFGIENAGDVGHIMFTISGLEFRALVMLHYSAGKKALHFLNLFEGDERTAKQESNFESFYTEIGNQFCGEIKRNLYKQFDHLGMSTPSLLSPTTSLLDIENPLLVAKCHQSYEVDSHFALGGSIYVFSNQSLEFSFDNASTTEVISTGELEFF
jgi:CheY-specific phosphatase CheX